MRRESFARAAGTDRLDLLYDVSHNTAKRERHVVDGRERDLLEVEMRRGADGRDLCVTGDDRTNLVGPIG